MNFVLNDNQSVNFIKEDAYEYEGFQRRIKQSRANANITALTQCVLLRGKISDIISMCACFLFQSALCFRNGKCSHETKMSPFCKIRVFVMNIVYFPRRCS